MRRKRILIVIALISSMVVFNTVGISATDENLSIAQMEDLKQENQQQIDELQRQIDEAQQKLQQAENDESAKQQYQQALSDKINLQQENISYVENQISTLDSQISTLNDNIAYLETEMEALKINIDTNMEQFKKRLKAMYISGNDSLASVLVGANSFFDILTKMEFIARISSHDNALMETLKSQIKDYNEDKEILLLSKEELENKKDQSTQKREEFSNILNQLSADFENTQDELDKLSLEKQALNMNIEDLQRYQNEQEEEEKRIQEAIKQYYIQSSVSQSQSVANSISSSIANSISEVKKSESISNSISVLQSVEKSRAESLLSSIVASQSVSQSEYESISMSIEESQRQTTIPTTQAPVITTPEPIVQVTEPPVNNYITGGTFNWPVPNFYTITEYYEVRSWNNQGMHYGIDISGIDVAGADIVSAEAGTVILAVNNCSHDYPKYSSCGCGGGFGNYVIVDHGGGYCTLYGHCQSVDVSVGDYVSRGQVIAHVGTTGYSTGYHLHFEVRYNGQRIDPLPFLS
ncbi:MAG: murein hydrolase activator EnvC family protein [Oscillospiraceae bacterium]